MPTQKSDARRITGAINYRVLIGLLLIVMSVAGVWGVIQLNRSTAEVFVAKDTIVAGQTISRDQLSVAEVNLAERSDKYLSTADFKDGVVANETIAGGELVAVRYLSDELDLATTTVVITTTNVPAQAIAPGVQVEIWLSAALSRGEYAQPVKLTSDAVVKAISETEQLGAAKGSRVELQVPNELAPEIVHAQASGSQLTILETSAR